MAMLAGGLTERHIELTWKCSTCEHRNLGRHMVCQRCGNPKDDSEEYEMPADPSAVASVEDPELLRMAEAGANWSCAYCGSNQRDSSGGCLRCGAGRGEGANAAKAPSIDLGPEPEIGPPRWPVRVLYSILGLVTGVVVIAGGCALISSGKPERERAPRATVITPRVQRMDFDAKVASVSWSRSITVDKWKLEPHEDFADNVPAGAVDVRSAGQRVHHNEDVYDHDETVYETVEVPDGYRTETYSEREACGEDCSTTRRTCRDVCTRTSRSCRQVCTNKKNGFASCRDECTGGDERCHQECSGGDRTCTTRYCNVTKTRSIPKTRTERRSHIEKRYRSVPRYAPWVTFRSWEWVSVRKVDDSGNDASPRWPDAGVVSADTSTPKPGAEREQRSERLEVNIVTDDGMTYPYTPSSEEELARLSPGTALKVRIVGGSVTVL